jgi:phosphotransferase system IIB component
MRQFHIHSLLLVSILALGSPLPAYSSSDMKQCKYIKSDIGPLKAKITKVLGRAKTELHQLEVIGHSFADNKQAADDFQKKLTKQEEIEVDNSIKKINELAQSLENHIEKAEGQIRSEDANLTPLKTNLKMIRKITSQVNEEKNKFLTFINSVLKKEQNVKKIFGDFIEVKKDTKEEIDHLVEEFEKNIICS